MSSDATTIEQAGLAERERVLALLREKEAELRALGVMRLRLFGSMARGEARPESDVDLMAEIDHRSRFSLLDLVGLQFDLGALIGRRVEIATAIEKDAAAHAPTLRSRRDRGFLMSFEDVPSRLEDILDAIADIQNFVSGKSFDDY